MALPTMTPEMRAAALARSVEVRKERAEVKARLKQGTVTLADIINQGATNDVIGKMPVSSLLQSLPGVGKVRASELMAKAEIAEGRRVRGLGVNQRAALEELVPA
jgi:signal recognition particle GTPase